MNWLESVKKNIFPLSIEKKYIQKALTEWFYNGDTYDIEEPIEDCELCGHTNIRYQFTIQNKFNYNILLIGSECITKFDIKAIDEKGNLLSHEATGRKVKSDRHKLIAEAQKKRVIASLLKLASLDQKFEINSFIDYYQDRKAFTPKQLKLLIWRLGKNKIPYKKNDFKMVIRRDREKKQLFEMDELGIKQIWGCMSTSQQKLYDEYIG